MSADEDAFSIKHENVQSRLLCEKEESLEEGEIDFNDDPDRKPPVSNAQDYTLLEASLRSELFARLGSKTVSKNSVLRCSADSTVNKGVESLVEYKKSQRGVGNQPLEGTEQNLISDIGGISLSFSGIILVELPAENDEEECKNKTSIFCFLFAQPYRLLTFMKC